MPIPVRHTTKTVTASGSCTTFSDGRSHWGSHSNRSSPASRPMFLRKADKLPRTMTIFDAGVNLARQQVDPGEQAQRAMALVFMITRPSRVRPRLRRPVGGGAADRLDAWLLVVGDDRDVR